MEMKYIATHGWTNKQLQRAVEGDGGLRKALTMFNPNSSLSNPEELVKTMPVPKSRL